MQIWSGYKSGQVNIWFSQKNESIGGAAPSVDFVCIGEFCYAIC